MRKMYVWMIGVVMAVLSCAKPGAKDPVVPVQEKALLKVMTYNIRIGNPPSQPSGYVDLEATAKAILSAAPDLVALQEVDRFTTRSGPQLDQAKRLAELTGMHYYFAKAIDRSNGEYGVGILSKFPISQPVTYSLPIHSGTGAELRAAALVKVTIPQGKTIYFVSTHLDHLTDSNRELQSRELLKAIAPFGDSPLIVGGDFNMPTSNDTWNILKTALTLPCTACPSTFSAVNPTTAIDFLLLNKAATNYFKLKSYQTVMERYASDHLPVIAEYEYPKN